MKAETSANRREVLAAFRCLVAAAAVDSILGWHALHVERALKDYHTATVSRRFPL